MQLQKILIHSFFIANNLLKRCLFLARQIAIHIDDRSLSFSYREMRVSYRNPSSDTPQVLDLESSHPSQMIPRTNQIYVEADAVVKIFLVFLPSKVKFQE